MRANTGPRPTGLYGGAAEVSPRLEALRPDGAAHRGPSWPSPWPSPSQRCETPWRGRRSTTRSPARRSLFRDLEHHRLGPSRSRRPSSSAGSDSGFYAYIQSALNPAPSPAPAAVPGATGCRSGDRSRSRPRQHPRPDQSAPWLLRQRSGHAPRRPGGASWAPHRSDGRHRGWRASTCTSRGPIVKKVVDDATVEVASGRPRAERTSLPTPPSRRSPRGAAHIRIAYLVNLYAIDEGLRLEPSPVPRAPAVIFASKSSVTRSQERAGLQHAADVGGRLDLQERQIDAAVERRSRPQPLRP